jgi:hypothetical protein
MVGGLLMELEDHNCQPVAEAAGHRGPHRLQHSLSRAVWDEQLVADIASPTCWTPGNWPPAVRPRTTRPWPSEPPPTAPGRSGT